jgi:cell division protein FtsL
MAAVAERARPSPAAPRTSRSRVRRRKVANGVVWIVLAGALLAGVVALNVAVLRQNLQLDELGRQRAKLRADTAALQSRLASEAAVGRIQALAQRDFGLAPADPAQTTYVDLRR